MDGRMTQFEEEEKCVCCCTLYDMQLLTTAVPFFLDCQVENKRGGVNGLKWRPQLSIRYYGFCRGRSPMIARLASGAVTTTTTTKEEE